MNNHGIQAGVAGSGPFATLYAPTMLNHLEFGSGTGPEAVGPASDRDAIIKSAERMIRSSNEYRQWIAYLKDAVGLRRCFVLGNIQGNEAVDVEMHHFPATLYDICWMVSGRQKAENGRYSSATIADEALGLHVSWMVGVVPLCATVHELYHKNIIQLSIQQVYGNWQQMNERYANYLPYGLQHKIHAASQITPEQVAQHASSIIYGPQQTATHYQ